MSKKELATVDEVDIKKFMGAWYVIAHIPLFPSKDAFNAVEQYRLGDSDQVDVLHTFNDGGFDGELKAFTPTAFPQHEGEEGVWGMRLIWPFKSDYRIIYLTDNYTETIIGRNKRDYVWIMARAPELNEDRYRALVQTVGQFGYDENKLRKVPQQPLASRDTPADVKHFESGH